MEGEPQARPVGALMFSCNGRGEGLFGEPGFDSRTLASFLPVPSSGFFCNGAPLPFAGLGHGQLRGFWLLASSAMARPSCLRCLIVIIPGF